MSTRSTLPYLEKSRSNSDWRVSYSKFPTNIGLILTTRANTWITHQKNKTKKQKNLPNQITINQIRKRTRTYINNQPTTLIFAGNKQQHACSKIFSFRVFKKIPTLFLASFTFYLSRETNTGKERDYLKDLEQIGSEKQTLEETERENYAQDRRRFIRSKWSPK